MKAQNNISFTIVANHTMRIQEMAYYEKFEISTDEYLKINNNSRDSRKRTYFSTEYKVNHNFPKNIPLSNF